MFGLSFIVLKAFAWVPSCPPAGAAQSEGAGRGKTAGTAGKALGVKEVESLGPAPSESKELLEAGFSKLSLFKIFWLKASKALACFSICRIFPCRRLCWQLLRGCLWSGHSPEFLGSSAHRDFLGNASKVYHMTGSEQAESLQVFMFKWKYVYVSMCVCSGIMSWLNFDFKIISLKAAITKDFTNPVPPQCRGG